MQACKRRTSADNACPAGSRTGMGTHCAYAYTPASLIWPQRQGCQAVSQINWITAQYFWEARTGADRARAASGPHAHGHPLRGAQSAASVYSGACSVPVSRSNRHLSSAGEPKGACMRCSAVNLM